MLSQSSFDDFLGMDMLICLIFGILLNVYNKFFNSTS